MDFIRRGAIHYKRNRLCGNKELANEKTIINYFGNYNAFIIEVNLASFLHLSKNNFIISPFCVNFVEFAQKREAEHGYV